MLLGRWQQCVLPWGHISATWRIRLNLCILRPTRVHNRNGKWIGSTVFAQLTAESAYTLQWAPLSTRIALSHGDLDLPRNTWCFGPMRAHNRNGTSIGSAVFAQMTAECPYGLPVSPSKLFLPMLASRPYVIHGSLDPPESRTQMVTWSPHSHFVLVRTISSLLSRYLYVQNIYIRLIYVSFRYHM